MNVPAGTITWWVLTSLSSIFVILPPMVSALDDNDRRNVSVTITNLTKGQRFSAPLVWSHKESMRFFELGKPASPALQASAESGNTGILSDVLIRSSDVSDVVKSVQGLLNAGRSVTLTVEAGGEFDRISWVSMMNPTNDGFVTVQGVRIPKDDKAVVVFAPGYDAGTELNDELCSSIPGSICRGQGLSSGSGEGFIHLHTGIHGIGDLKSDEWDWRNPVAKISIQRVK